MSCCAESLYSADGAAGSGFQTTNMRRILTVLTVVMLAAAAAGPVAASDDAAARSLVIGVNAFRQGSLEASIEALSDALRGSLTSREAAKALYYRGLAYRALGKPGQAIADLDAAIALRNGLTPRAARACGGQSRGRLSGGRDHDRRNGRTGHGR